MTKRRRSKDNRMLQDAAATLFRQHGIPIHAARLLAETTRIDSTDAILETIRQWKDRHGHLDQAASNPLGTVQLQPSAWRARYKGERRTLARRDKRNGTA